jgi:hypothetical protein
MVVEEYSLVAWSTWAWFEDPSHAIIIVGWASCRACPPTSLRA